MSSAPTTVVLPGEYLELDLPPNIDPDCTLAIEARTDAPSNKCSKVSQLWPQPQSVEAVASRVRLVNDTAEQRTVRRHEHLCQARHTTTVVPTSPVGPHPSPPHPFLKQLTSNWFLLRCCRSWPWQHPTRHHPQPVPRRAPNSRRSF